jgi:hypothetical protein
MKRRLAGLVLALVAACVLASQAAAATEVDHFTDTFENDELCGVSGTTVTDGSVVFSGTFWAVFTADSGKSVTVFTAGPVVVSEPVIDEEAGTATVYSTYRGLPEKLSITNGPTLLRDAGTVTFVDVFEYTGDPEEPLGDEIDFYMQDLHGPHPDLLSDFEAFCDVLGGYLQDP